MLSPYTCSTSLAKSFLFQSSPPLSCFSPRNPRTPSSALRICFVASSSSGSTNSDEDQEDLAGRRANFGGLQLEDTVSINSGKLRLDSWISSRIGGISRARVQSSIRSGLVTVNGRVVDKVVHPAPGNATGTLVNGVLHHCSLPLVAFSNEEFLSEAEDNSDAELSSFSTGENPNDGLYSRRSGASIRPGIVHRLDKGTSGLLVVAKDEHSHAHLSEQFKLHTIQRLYVSLTSGVPSPMAGRVEVPIGRDLNNRIRMAAISGSNISRQARHAASRYKVIEILAGGGSALVEWRLETGRTHQIRAHAKYLGIPLLGDEVYGGTKSMALSLLRPRTPPSRHGQLLQLVSQLERHCLHALALGFMHPHTMENVYFQCPPPADFAEILGQLRKISTVKHSFEE
ncbi:hypothetical protein I3843_07G142400 [Carya illinoinensis]|uniref:RNA pseudouridine synthase 2, chloroplastic isoform X2 n=1 Tax=Carya illinoinensis TaxID=32201 RepID=UPI001C718F93|nr:RNA pseudouridine synthase 2, chloroplastic isoform X2 [Carya illinoinensis]KAG7971590.1 hypothetical protein I3843_07G142400 [Carya illinoinensis]KAG7971591.1 hypothetical protein I3843_07G142400 [Carya illinoinensis]